MINHNILSTIINKICFQIHQQKSKKYLFDVVQSRLLTECLIFNMLYNGPRLQY